MHIFLSSQIEASGDALFLRMSSAAEQTCWFESLQQYITELREYEQRKLQYTIDDQERVAK